jgi:flagellar biosynthesis protein FliP
MVRFYARPNGRKWLTQRNNMPFARTPESQVVASCGQFLYLFQMIPQIDKIPRRDAIAANKRLFGLSFH